MIADFANHDTPVWQHVDVTVCNPAQRKVARRNRKTGGSLRGIVSPGHLVDDALDDDHLNVDVTGHVGQELGDEIVDGSGGEADGVALRAGAEPGQLRAAITADSRPPG